MSRIEIGRSLTSGCPVQVSEDMLQRHTLVFGSSGYGKTYLSHLLIREQMLNHGASLVAIDPEPATLYSLRGICQEAKLLPERVVMLDPADPDHAPPMNLFRSSLPPAMVVSELYDLLDSGDNAVRMQEFLYNSLTVAAWHGLFLSDVLRLLKDEVFRTDTLASTPLHPIDEIYQEAVDYFVYEFPEIKATDRQTTIGSAGIRVRRLLGHLLFLRSFNAPTNAVDFGKLFERPGAVLVNLGRSSGLRDGHKQLLGTMLVRFLDAASTRRQGDCPVILAIDEAAFLLPFVVESVRDIVNMARKRNIRLLISTQYPGDIPSVLQGSLKTSTQVKVFFHDAGSEADHTARYIKSQVTEPQLPALPIPVTERKMALYAPRWDKPTNRPYPLVADYDGNDLDVPWPFPLPIKHEQIRTAIKAFVSWAYHVNPPLCLENGMIAEDVFRAMPPGSVRLQWQRVGNEYHGFALFDPPSQPVAPGEAYWLNRLRTLENGEAIVIVGSNPPEECRIARVEPRTDASAWYVARSRDRFRYVPPQDSERKEAMAEAVVEADIFPEAELAGEAIPAIPVPDRKLTLPITPKQPAPPSHAPLPKDDQLARPPASPPGKASERKPARDSRSVA